MRYELLRLMFKEEVRLHTALYNNKQFFVFPLIIMLFTLFICLGFIYLTTGEFAAQEISLLIIFIFFTSGIMSGAFGLHARDYLERRFGEFGKLFSNALLLPIKLKDIFLITAVKDILFYLLWFILPVVLGYLIALLIAGKSVIMVPVLLLSLLFSFVFGVFFTFFITVLYERSKALFFSLLIVIGSVTAYFSLSYDVLSYFPPYMIYENFNFKNIAILIVSLSALIILTYLSIGREYKTSVRRASERKSISFEKNLDPFLIKDFIDLKRTGGLFAKPFFNVFLPSLLLLFIFSSVNYLINFTVGIMFFAIIIGTLSTTLLNSLITSDSVAYYKFLPVSLEKHIRTKFLMTMVIASVQSLVLLVIFALINHELGQLLSAFLIFLAVLILNLAMNFYMTGLNPNEYLLNGTIFVKYALMFVPVLLVAMLISLIMPLGFFTLLVFLVFSAVLADLILKRGLKKWELMDEVK